MTDRSYSSYQKTISSLDQNNKAVGLVGGSFNNVSPGVNVKSGYNRSDYNYFRKTGQPSNRKDLLDLYQDSYDKVGIVKNVIDLMSDFASKGIRIKHTTPSVQRFYEKWAKKVNMLERSERFLNSLYRLGTVVTYKSYGIIGKDNEKELKKVTALIESDGEFDLKKFKNRYVPVRYTFLNPSSIEVLGENMGISLGTNIYILKLNENFLNPTNNYLVSQSKNIDVLKKITEGLPKSLREAILNKKPYYELDPDRVSVFNYRKDDWVSWGKAITHAILNDLQVLERLKLADLSALDGAISNIRLWTVGQIGDSPQTTFLPSPEMLNKVRDILANNVGGGTMDLVWGPDLSFKESSTNVHEFLGEEKYIPTIDAIYDGLGVPSPLRSGAKNSEEGISLKTLIERLNYGRNALIEFWESEINQIAKSCGFSRAGLLEFDHMVFTDEAAYKQLLINLSDRGIITDDTLREQFNFSNKIEKAKIKREMKERGKKIPNKASPYHVSQTDHDYKKILLSGGTVTPSEIGVDLLPRKPGEETRQEMLVKEKEKDRTFTENVGRPKNITETTKRNPKTGQNIKISRSNEMFLWASATQDFIHKNLVPGLECIFGKKNLRQLTVEEADAFEQLKCSILFSFEPFEEINKEVLFEKLQNYISSNYYEDAKFLSAETQNSLKRELTLDEKRNIYALLYVQKQEK